MIGERIKRARIAAGLSQREAAQRAELSAMAISKFERGESTPTSGTLIRLARALGTRTEFFFRPDTVELGQPEYRKRSSLGKKALAQIEADILDQVERLLEIATLFPVLPVPDFTVPAEVPTRIASMDDVETTARVLREAWRLGLNAIPSLADTLEERGLLVLTSAADGQGKFDGLAATVSGRPLVVVGRDWPGDRQRFTMAHELGHLVLAGRLFTRLNEEKACDRFAGAFLVPRQTVVSELGSHRSRLEPRELHSLKHAYGLSMMAWVFRARDAAVITDRTADIVFRMFSKRGWRKLEPGDPVAPEVPKLFERLVIRALAEDMISMSKGAELMAMSISQLRQRLHLESPRGPAHQ